MRRKRSRKIGEEISKGNKERRKRNLSDIKAQANSWVIPKTARTGCT
jgi:hypothetical protein